MPTITFKEHEYTCEPGETILACLRRHRVFVPYACQSGVCQSCMMQAVSGQPTHEAQHGLKDTLVEQQHFLACMCKPEEDMEVSLFDASKVWERAEVVEKSLLNESVVRIRLQTEGKMRYKAGQFINIQHPTQEDCIRSYSLASIPDEEALELHIKRMPDGVMSNFLHDALNIGDKIDIMGALGESFYTKRDSEQPILMIGIGTGLAPLYGIVRDAIAQEHQGNIHLYHASLATAGLYYMDELRAFAEQNPSCTYIPCVLHGDAPQGGQQGNIQQIIAQNHANLTGYRIYVCGDPAMVEALKKHCFLAGASMADIYSDPFDFSA